MQRHAENCWTRQQGKKKHNLIASCRERETPLKRPTLIFRSFFGIAVKPGGTATLAAGLVRLQTMAQLVDHPRKMDLLKSWCLATPNFHEKSRHIPWRCEIPIEVMVESCYIAIASKNVSIKSKKSVAEPCCHCCRHRLPKTCTALLWQTSGYRYLDLVGWLRLTSTWGCSRAC